MKISEKLKTILDLANRRGAFTVDESVEAKLVLIEVQKLEKLESEQLPESATKEAPKAGSKKS